MGNGTKIGLVLALVLVVVVAINIGDSPEKKGPKEGPSKEETTKKSNEGKPDPRRAAVDPSRTGNRNNRATPGGSESSRTNANRNNSSARGNGSYDAGRNRRLSGGQPGRTNTNPNPNAGRTNVGNTPRTPVNGNGAPGTTPRTGENRRAALAGNQPGSASNALNGNRAGGINPSPSGAGERNRPTPPAGTVPPVKKPETETVKKPETEKNDPRSRLMGSKPNESTPKPEEKPARSNATPEKPKPSGSDKKWPVTHEISEGDSLWDIAGRYYEKPTLFTLILEHNPQLGDGSDLRIGDKLKIPAPPKAVASKTRKSPTNSGAAKKPRAGYTTYTIQEGDTLYDIAEDRLGSGLRWTEIQSANPGLDPSRLQVGKTIELPST